MRDRRTQINAALNARGIDPAAALSRYQLKELIRVVELCGGRIRFDPEGAATPAVKAAYDTDPDQGANAAIVFTAHTGGAAGNSLKVQFANTATDGHNDVTVTYTATKAGVITLVVGIKTAVTLASEVMTALAADANTIIDYALKTGNDGTGTVATMAAKALAGGVDAIADATSAFVITPA